MDANGNGSRLRIYEIIISFLLGLLVAIVGAYFVAQKDVISRREFSEQNVRFEQHLEAHDKEIGQIVQAAFQNTNDLTRVIEDLKITARPLPPR